MKISRRTFAKTLAAGASAAGFSKLLAAEHSSGLSVKSAKLQLELGNDGSIRNAHFRDQQRAISGEIRFGACTANSNTAVHASEQAISFEREISCGANRAHVVERFLPMPDGVQWQVEIMGKGAPWTTPIEFHLRYPVTPDVQFWTAWADPEPAAGSSNPPSDTGKRKPGTESLGLQWHDPLVTVRPRDRKLFYGAPPFDYDNPHKGFIPSDTDLFSIPVATFSEAACDSGLSVAVALDGVLLDLTLDTSSDGSIVFTHLFHRISSEAPIRLTVDLVPHEAGWRGGLRYLTRKFPRYFAPVNQKVANELSGTAAYPSSRGPAIDPVQLKAMAFRTIWMASFDFPYMGLFLPPVPDSTPWPRFSPRGANGSSGTITIQQMAAYADRMHALGFHVLNYFNVTEFGAHMSRPWAATAPGMTPEDWEDPREFLQAHFPAAVLRNPQGSPYYSWGGAVAMDPGEPAYRDFLMSQARRQIKSFPYSDGFCIDRLDWLRFYNGRRDDHVSWFDNHASESLVISWRQLIDRLSPEVHAAGKVIFVNNHTKRIDLLHNIDGIYDEFDYYPASLNTTAFLGVQRPVLGWTTDTATLRPDPDAYFQRNLYLGVFPTAPFPGNNHCILPDPWADQQYVDYGPMLDAIRGKRWLLLPHSVRVVSGAARANLFETADGVVMPVMLGGAEKEAVVELNGTKVHSAEVLYPASAVWKVLSLAPANNGKVRIQVPLVRGCAMVRLKG